MPQRVPPMSPVARQALMEEMKKRNGIGEV
jgi:hypothetical protein